LQAFGYSKAVSRRTVHAITTLTIDKKIPYDFKANQNDKWRQIHTTQIRHVTPYTAVNRLEKALKPVPNLPDKFLAYVQHFEPYQPAHDEMRDNEKPHDFDNVQ